MNVWFGATLRGDNDPITIGEGSNIQDGAILHTDDGVPLTVGSRGHGRPYGHAARLHGRRRLADRYQRGRAEPGRDRQALPDCLIGANTLIPEGRVIPDRSLVVGTPGRRIIRELTDAEIGHLENNAKSYLVNKDRFAKGLRRIG